MRQDELFESSGSAEQEPAPLGDAAARRAAVRVFDRPLLVEAGAGTGKTAALVARVLTWVLGPGWERSVERLADAKRPETDVASREDEIASRTLGGVTAITFTEAAAAEMAARVGEGLAQVQAAASSGDGLDPKTLPVGLALDVLPDAGEIAIRSRALRAALDQFDVGTFHSFCRRILAAHPFEAGLSPTFELDANGRRTEELLRAEMEAFLRDGVTEELETHLVLLARLGLGPSELEEAVLAVHQAGARAVDFESDPLREEVARDLLRSFRELLGEFCDCAAGPLSQVKRGPATLTLCDELATLHAHSVGFPSGAAPSGAKEEFLALQAKALETMSTSALNKLAKWKKAEFTQGEVAAIAAEPEEVQERIQRTALRLAETLPPFLALDPRLLESGRRVVHAILARLEVTLRAQGVASYGDLLSETRDLLRDQPAIAARIRARIEQLLVDEFQDTDSIQCDIVRSLGLSGPKSADGPSLFVVGDPKQSIYSWRGADLAAYGAFCRDLEREGGRVLELTTNFRSVPAVLEEVRRCVQPVMEEVTDIQPAFVSLEAHRPDKTGETGEPASDGGPVIEHWISWNRDPATGFPSPGEGKAAESYATEAEAVARDLRLRIDSGELAPGQAALLFRAMSGADLYLEALRRAGIPFEVKSDRSYYQRREVLDASALVRAVLDPTDRIALASFLRTPFVGMPDAALVRFLASDLIERIGARSGPDRALLEDLRLELDRIAGSLSGEIPGIADVAGWSASVHASLVHLLHARAEFASLPIDVWIDRLRERFLVEVTEAARYLGTYRLSNLERFFRDLLTSFFELDGDTDAVLRRLRSDVGRDGKDDRTRVQDTMANAVQVLTVHGAKGLEFDHVYLVQTHKGEGRGRGSETASFHRRGDSVAYSLFGAKTPNFAALQREAADAGRAERVRLLYVALTRAADRLVLLGDRSSQGGPGGWRVAKKTSELLSLRVGFPLAQLAEQAREGDRSPIVDAEGVLWRLTVHVAEDGQQGRAAPGSAKGTAADLATPQRVAAESEQLVSLRRGARRHAARPYQGRASEGPPSHGLAPETEDAGSSTAERGAVSPRIATAVGTLLHRWLERGLPGRGTQEEEIEEALRADLSQLLHTQDPTLLDPAVERALRILTRMDANGLRDRLERLAPSIVARELSLISSPGPEDDGPVSFVAGAIDLLLRDPDSGQLVVIDFKTDHVATVEDASRQAQAHSAQGRTYTAAVRRALGLERCPAFELWFLSAPTPECAIVRRSFEEPS